MTKSVTKEKEALQVICTPFDRLKRVLQPRQKLPQLSMTPNSLFFLRHCLNKWQSEPPIAWLSFIAYRSQDFVRLFFVYITSRHRKKSDAGGCSTWNIGDCLWLGQPKRRRVI
jgi:hypothetical protein